MRCICIVTPDAVGPVKNGGIGTHCYFLARQFASAGQGVSLLLTTPVPPKDRERWKQFYAEQGVTLLYLQDIPDLPCPVHLGKDLVISLNVLSTLKNMSFDQVHFQDWRAHGFHCIQAKRTLGLFADTLLTVTAHSCTEWVDEGMGQWTLGGTGGSNLIYAERYCISHSDVLVCPSDYMRQWLVERGIPLAPDTRVMPNLYEPPLGTTSSEYTPEQGVLAFFGRLETRKGLELFCAALRALGQDDRQRIRSLLFVGKEGLCGAISAREYIRESLPDFADRIEFFLHLDSFAAQQLLRQRKATVCIPSLMDNLPYTVVECAVQRLPVLASCVGGIPEILPHSQLFEPTVPALAERLAHVLGNSSPPLDEPVYSQDKAQQGWMELSQFAVHETEFSFGEPLVSVCMAHYNHGAYIEAALNSLARQDYTNFEVLIVDDGSTGVDSQRMFAQLAQSFDGRFQFFLKHNEGLGASRNFCVQHAKGEYILFCDSDNIYLPDMITRFVRGMQRSEVHALTCHSYHFADAPDLPQTPACLYAPLGGDVVSGCLENVYGDANAMVKKSVFDAMGGFVAARHGCEDWEFFARLCLSGYELDAIPKVLYWYRLNPKGMRSTMSLYHSHNLVFSAYAQHLPSFAQQAFKHLLLPTFSGHSPSNAVIIRTMLKLGIFLEEKYVTHFPAGGWRQRIVSWLWHSCSVCITALRNK